MNLKPLDRDELHVSSFIVDMIKRGLCSVRLSVFFGFSPCASARGRGRPREGADRRPNDSRGLWSAG